MHDGIINMACTAICAARDRDEIRSKALCIL